MLGFDLSAIDEMDPSLSGGEQDFQCSHRLPTTSVSPVLVPAAIGHPFYECVPFSCLLPWATHCTSVSPVLNRASCNL